MEQGLWKWISSSTLLASMCCLPSVILVMFSLSSVTYAAALSNNLYFSSVRWWLYLASFLFISYGLYRTFKADGICSIDDVKRERKKVINTSLTVFLITLVSYLIFNYVILELVGIAVGLPWEDSAIWN